MIRENPIGRSCPSLETRGPGHRRASPPGRRATSPEAPCVTFSDSLLQSELSGHEKGAFTGATALRKGRIELAEGGAVFLDEIGEMKPELQARLLRVLQQRSFERVGGARTLEADVRWIAATNVDLGVAMAEGRFREDLYHRLVVFPVALLPLRQRREDILPLAAHLLQRAGPRVGGGVRRLSPAAHGALHAAPPFSPPAAPLRPLRMPGSCPMCMLWSYVAPELGATPC